MVAVKFRNFHTVHYKVVYKQIKPRNVKRNSLGNFFVKLILFYFSFQFQSADTLESETSEKIREQEIEESSSK